MAYQSLYRKYRPQRFAEVVGQTHVTTAVRNAVRDERVGHAYLFSGPRGTGKTTMARLLAKALNCTARTPDGDACGVCDNCVGVADGRFLDLFELDAASNNGVDAMRDLTESVHLGLGPTSTYKVYLIDEVHMLSTGASNALLKTLEEPPEHVVFVLATTSPEKVLPTIRSRTPALRVLALLARRDRRASRVGERAGRHRRRSRSARDPRPGRGRFDARRAVAPRPGHRARRARRRAGRVRCSAVPTSRCACACSTRSPTKTPPTRSSRVGELLDAGFDPRRITEDLLATARDGFLLTSAKGRVRVDAPEDDVARLVRARRA